MDIPLGAMHEWVVEVPDLVEEMDLVFARKQCRANAVYGRISPSLIVKSTLLVQKLDKLRVRLASPEIEVTDLKVAPKVATIVSLSAVVGDEPHCVIGGH